MQIEIKKQAGVSIFISYNTVLKLKTVNKDKDHYILIQRSICQENIRIVNIHVPNIVLPKYIKQIILDLKEEIDSNATHFPQGTYHLNTKSEKKHLSYFIL